MLTFLLTASALVVFCAGAASTVVNEVAAEFRAEIGHDVVVHVGTVGHIRKRLDAGENADVVIVSARALNALQKQAAIVPESKVALGRSPMGVGVRAGTPLPDLSSTEAFKRLLLGARAIAATDPKSGASSGIYFARLLGRLGIAGAVAPKERLVPGGRSCELVVRHIADVCVQNATEILPVKGVVLAGRLPPAIQNSITYSAAVWKRSAQPNAARSFIAQLSAPRHASLWRRAGFDSTER